jgi:amphi-Trp domain-containing protein
MAKRELEFSTRLTREDVAGLIEAIIDGLKDGRLKVQKSSDILELEVPRVVDLEIEASIDEERAEFEIEISWRTNRAENPDLAPDDPTSAPVSLRGKAAAPAQKKAAAKKASPESGGAKSVSKAAAPKASGSKASASKASASKASASKASGPKSGSAKKETPAGKAPGVPKKG